MKMYANKTNKIIGISCNYIFFVYLNRDDAFIVLAKVT